MHILFMKLFYISYCITLLMILLLLLRKILNRLLWGEGRAILWGIVFVAAFFIGLTSTGRIYYVGHDLPATIFPPIKVTLYHSQTGELGAMLDIWQGDHWWWRTYSVQTIINIIMLIWFAGFMAFILWQAVIYFRIKLAITKLPEEQGIISSALFEGERILWYSIS